jgi:hypothetical protein
MKTSVSRSQHSTICPTNPPRAVLDVFRAAASRDCVGTALGQQAAGDDAGNWRIVFVPDEHHFYVWYADRGVASDRLWLTIEDFMARTPRDAVHKRCRLAKSLGDALT